MATFEIKMPKLGESITEGTIVSWSVKVGDTIQEDDILFEVSTAKVSAEIPSPVAGKVQEILFPEGETVDVGTTVAIILLENNQEDSSHESASASTQTPKDQPVSGAEKEKDIPAAEETKISPASVSREEGRWYSPIVLQLAQEAQIPQSELDGIPGTGYMGRLSKQDIKNYIAQKKNDTARQIQTATQAATGTTSTQQPRPTSNTTSSPTVSSGAPSQTKTEIPPAASSTPADVSGKEEIVEMDRVARIIADHMVMSKKVSPHVTTFVEADVTKLVKWRTRTKDEFLKRTGIGLTYLPAIAEATTKALAEFPSVNASVDGYKIIRKKHINLGIAVSLPDGNLVVPVIHDADKLNLNGLAVHIDQLANQARSNKLTPTDIQGGTFTITNFGTFKNLFATPIINQPEVAILGVGYIEKKPAVVETPDGDVIAIRHKMYLSLSYDHRIINGALGGQFLRRIADYLENWNVYEK